MHEGSYSKNIVPGGAAGVPALVWGCTAGVPAGDMRYSMVMLREAAEGVPAEFMG